MLCYVLQSRFHIYFYICVGSHTHAVFFFKDLKSIVKDMSFMLFFYVYGKIQINLSRRD